MNPEYEKRLEAEMDLALKGLPELRAPDTLVPRVLTALARRAALPWYRQPWQVWPVRLRYAALVVLLGSFGALCFASWELARAAGTQLALQEVGQAFSGAIALGNAGLAMLRGLVLALQHFKPIILAGGLVALALAWALFITLGTACAKLALARRPSRLPARIVSPRGTAPGQVLI